MFDHTTDTIIAAFDAGTLLVKQLRPIHDALGKRERIAIVSIAAGGETQGYVLPEGETEWLSDSINSPWGDEMHRAVERVSGIKVGPVSFQRWDPLARLLAG